MWPFKNKTRPARGTLGELAPEGYSPDDCASGHVHPDVEAAQLRALINAARRREEIAEAEHQVRMAVLRWRREHPDIVAARAAGEKK